MLSIKFILGIVALFVVILLIFLYINNKEMGGPAAKSTDVPGAIRYLPLGDSYTIGESVAENDRWPNQLTAKYAATDKTLQIIANPSITGYTSQNLIDHELPLVDSLRPDFVSVLIGVNDYVQGIEAQTFHKNLDYIVKTLKQKLKEPGNIVLVTIPDFGKTRAGAQFGSPAQSETGIIAFNNIIKEVALAHEVSVADIFPVSQAVASDPSLTADDGLHPSAKQYAIWTEIILETMQSNKLPISSPKDTL